MTTWNPSDSIFSHSSDAGFQQWATELLNAFTNGAYGGGGPIYSNLTQTADTGQLAAATLAAAARPATSTALGYICLTLNDTQGGTSPVAIKIEVGTGNNSTSGGVWVTVGRGFDGAGNVQNIWIARTQYNLVPFSTSTNYSTFACCVDGTLNIIFKNQGGPSKCTGFVFLMNRGADLSTGAANSDSLQVCVSSTSAQLSFVNISMAGSGSAGTTHTNSCSVPGGITASAVGGVAQVFKHYVAAPASQVRPLRSLLCALNTECPPTSNITASAVVAGDSHTYKPITLGGSQYPIYNNVSGWNLLILWE